MKTSLRVAVLLWALFLAVCLARGDSVVVINEIMYHPFTNEVELEWVELQNQFSVDVDLAGWRIDGAIHYDFPEGSLIAAGGYLVVAIAPTALTATGATNVVGPFRGRLGNNGDRIQVKNRNDRLIDEVIYGVEGDWPVAPDGAGPSLARRRRHLTGSNPSNWRTSLQTGGTPGRENFPVQVPTILTTTVLGAAGTWKFHDGGVDLGTGWRSSGFDDSGWSSGAALFYIEDAALPAVKNTPLAPGRITYYFRSQFAVTGEVSATELSLRPLIDDGAVIYVNGVEVSRVNMPDGPVSYSTPSTGIVGDAGFGDPIVVPSGNLVQGANTIAVEVHQGPIRAAYADVVLGSGPVGYWRLGEATGTALDLASAAGAPQNGAQNGVYTGLSAASLTQAGPRPTDRLGGQALLGFEGNNGAPTFAGNGDGGNDVVTVADPGVFNFATTRQLTLEAWVNGGAAQEDGAAILAKGTGGGGEQYALDVVGGLYRFFAWDGGAPNTPFVTSASVGPSGTWQHVVAVLDQPAGRMKIYVNGVERGSGTPRASLINTTHEVSIGARKNSGSANYDLNFNGRIDEVAIYPRALSTNEILAHYNAAFSDSAAFGIDTNDVVFGLEVATAETLPEAGAFELAFNELASSTNNAFWLELINPGAMGVSLDGCVIARFGGTNRDYVLPPELLPPGGLRQVTKAELGFGVDSGDRLVLYAPGRSNVLDAVVAKKDPRGRWPDGTGPWLFPQAATPGASNTVALRDELVINEIMFHHRELTPEPAIYSPTNTLVTISNAWKYHAEGLDLGTTWRLPDYDDSAWRSSNAVFYAPTNFFVLPAPKNTFVPLTNSAGTRIITFYFRTQFEFSGETNGLQLGLHSIIDDGAVFYLNGVEVWRLNMNPTASIIYGSLATVNVNIPVYTGPVRIPAEQLRVGLNTLAVEVHQVAATSSDFDFGAALLAWYELVPALPFRESSESWVEILNRSSQAVSLNGWRLDEGIDYRFPSNQTIAPGGYLVVAKDVAGLRALHPGIDVVGPFTNKLSHSSDLIVLKDPDNNPADEVRYSGPGRWPEAGDGGGSSLELRDPRADGTRAEAWAASDESGASVWTTFSWRGLSAPGQTTEPTLWHELALCLLDGAGEALIDDVSVIETPATTPKQLLANGRFDGGSTASWRFQGNHRLSRVEPEPGNPGNFVLHLVSTGPGEYQGNQVEATLTNNVAIVDGREYEISFRARWLTGKNKLNARLYFNRLARTVNLDVPRRNGTPGRVNTAWTTNLGPTFANLGHAPAVADAGRAVTVTVAASDPDGVAAMTLQYSVNGESWQALPMTLAPARAGSPGSFRDGMGEEHLVTAPAWERYQAAVPGQAAGSVVQFYVEAMDGAGALSTFPARGRESRALWAVRDAPLPASSLHEFRLIMTPADRTRLHTGTNTLSNELLGATVVEDEREVYYNCGVRLKGSFVGRNVARVGFHVQFNDDQPFRGVHRVVSVDRSMHTAIGNIGEILVKHIASHAGGIPDMHDDVARFSAPIASYSTMALLRVSGFDNDYLDAQFNHGSEGPIFEVEVLRWNNATVDGNPLSPKQVGNESGGTGYANLELQNYGDSADSYRWFFLLANDRTADDFTGALAVSKTFGLSGTAFDTQSRQVLDMDEWLRTMAYAQLVGMADAYFTGANIHNFRVYIRPEDQRALFMPWDWDSAFQASTAASIFGSGNIAKLLTPPHQRRQYLNHLFDLLTTTFNISYMSRWTAHYGAVGQQDFTAYLNYIGARATFVLGQLPTATGFAIGSNGGNDFTTNTSTINLTGTAPISVRTIEVNGVAYAPIWTSSTNWTLAVPLFFGTNQLALQGVDSAGRRLSNAVDSIQVINTGPLALLPVVINEWMADNAGPGGLPDPADGLFQDWFELFNPNPIAVNLGGLHLTDNLAIPDKWRIPTNTIISGRGFLLVWADGNTNQNAATGGVDVDLHASFQLSGSGEAIGLFAADGVTPWSTVSFTAQAQNVSQGRFPDGDTNAVFAMTNFTPRAANTLAGLGEVRIVRVTRDGAVLKLQWNAVVGRAYRVDFKDAWETEEWTALSEPLHATSAIVEAQDPALPDGPRFYRVVLLR